MDGVDGRPLALVTGGCRRIGAAIAAALARRGYALALHGGHDAQPEPMLAGVLVTHATEWHGFVAAFDDPETAIRLHAEVVERFGRAPDLLINNASRFGQDRLDDITAADLAIHHAINCAAPTLLIQAFAAAATRRAPGERSVVNILDQRIDQPHGDQLAYTLSKLALAGLTRIAARTLAPNIRVNAVAPGLTIATPDYDDAQVARLGGRMPLQRLSTPDEIGEAVCWLAGARSVTGQVLYVDGGARLESFPQDFMHLER